MVQVATGDHCYAEYARRLDIAQLVRLVRLLGAYFSGQARKQPQKILEVEALSVSWHVSSVAAEILERWPNAFRQVLEQKLGAQRDHKSGRLREGWGSFYQQIYVAFPEPEFDFLRRAFEDYVADHWQGALGRRNRRFASDLLERSAWIPAKHAWQKMRISRVRFDELVRDGIIESETRSGASGREFTVVKRDDVNRQICIFSEQACLSTVAALLGIPIQRAYKFIPHLLPGLKKPAGKLQWQIPRERIDEILRFVAAQPMSKQWEKPVTSLGAILRFSKWHDEDIVKLLDAALSGELLPVGRRSGTKINDLLFSRGDVAKWRESIHEKSIVFTVPQTARQLGIKQEVAYHLVRRGLLRTHTTRSRAGGALVHSNAILEFNENFVFASDEAKRVGCSPRYLIDKLARRGVAPVAGPRVDGCRQTLFRKCEKFEAGINTIR